MPNPLPARKVAGNKTGPVCRQRNQARQVEPKGAREDYSDALRAKCRKGSLHRKPADLPECPECNEPGVVVTRLGFSKKLAAKWYQTCTNTVKNFDGTPVKCHYFKVPKQPPPPKKQLDAIEQQRTADLAAKAAERAQRAVDRAEREALKNPGNEDLQLALASAKSHLEAAVVEAEAARRVVQQDDERGWSSTPPPQPSSSRVTLDMAQNSSATSTRTSTSQAQIDHDREVALRLQKSIWDAETDASPDSAKTAHSSPDAEPPAPADKSVGVHPGTAGCPADASNRMCQAAHLQRQAADWLGEESVTSKGGSQNRMTSSSSPIVTPTPGTRVRNLRPFPLESNLNFKDFDDSIPGCSDVKEDGVKTSAKFNTGSDKRAARLNEGTHTETAADTQLGEEDTRMHKRRHSPSVTETPPPSTQPRSANHTLNKCRRKLSFSSVISISSDEPPQTQVKRQRTDCDVQVKREAVEERIDDVRAPRDAHPESRRAPTNTPSKPKPRPMRKSDSVSKTTGRAAAQVIARQEHNTSATVQPLSADTPPYAHIDAAVTSTLASITQRGGGNFGLNSPKGRSDEHSTDEGRTSAVSNLAPANGARGRQHSDPAPAEESPSDREQNATDGSTLGSSNKENYDVEATSRVVCPARPASVARSPLANSRGEDQELPVLEPLDSPDGPALASRPRHPRSLPNEQPHVHPITHLPGRNVLYDITCRQPCCVMVEEAEAGRAPWESDYDSDDYKPAPTGLSADSDIEDAVDEGEASEADDRGDTSDGASTDEHEGLGGLSRNSSDSSEDPQVADVADDERHLYVEESVDAAARKPWTHDLDNLEAWYCTVFLWIVNDGRPRQILLSMNTGETEVRLSDRPPIYTALGGLRPRACRLWDFTTSTWMAQEFDAVFSVSEFDQHTLLIRLPEVTRCLEFGKAIAYAKEPLWPALAEQGGQEVVITSEQDNEHAEVSTPVATSRQGTPTAGTSQQVQQRPKSIKKSRKGKEVVRG